MQLRGVSSRIHQLSKEKDLYTVTEISGIYSSLAKNILRFILHTKGLVATKFKEHLKEAEVALTTLKKSHL